jgi:hypothetical protein
MTTPPRDVFGGIQAAVLIFRGMGPQPKRAIRITVATR